MTRPHTTFAPRWRRRAPRAVATLAALALLAVGAGCIADLGTPPGFTRSEAVDVTGDGTVVGNVTTSGGRREAAVLGTDGEWTLLGTGFPGETGWSAAAAANADGLVVGTTGDANAGSTLAFAWDATHGFRTLPIEVPGRPYVKATDVNAAGQVIGTAGTGFLDGDAGFVYGPDGDLTMLDGASRLAIPAALNDAGTVVGTLTSPGGPGGGAWNAAVWAPPDYTPVMLPVPGINRYSAATAIGEDGTIAGDLTKIPEGGGSSSLVGLVWSEGTVTELPGLYQVGGVEGGSVVGAMTWPSTEGRDPAAALWRVGEPEPELLGSLGGASYATAIRDGRIVGTAELGDGGPRHAVRLAPAP